MYRFKIPFIPQKIGLYTISFFIMLFVGCQNALPPTPTIAPTPTEIEEDDDAYFCVVSEIYDKAIGEYNDVLFRILVDSQIQNSPVENIENIPTFFANLSSMRQFLEARVEVLPDCALEYNRLMLATISAAQDLMATRYFWIVNPDTTRNETRAAQAQEAFVDQYNDLSAFQNNFILKTQENP